MDKTIKTNEHCIVGLPRCGFAFSSTRSCFIGYSFEKSSMEKDFIRRILESNDIIPEEAGTSIKPAQLVFCSKICSKIITSQFCIILLNNEKKKEVEYANANVQMEYGLMLGFNKYVIPFQKEEDTLSFNISGLDTIKYTGKNFEAKATDAIDKAIYETTPERGSDVPIDQLKIAYLFSKNAVYNPIDNSGDRDIYRLGSPMGFNLLMDFSGLEYRFYGDFAHLRFENICYRVKLLHQILVDRVASFPERVKMGLIDVDQVKVILDLFEKLEIWLLVNSEDVKSQVLSYIKEKNICRKFDIFTIKNISERSDLFG
ncbi:MAG: hypothetical protein ABIJ12_06190 [bacterium]